MKRVKQNNPKRIALIAAAVKVCSERGVVNTALVDIAQEANVSLGNVYYYFKTKRSLIQTAFPTYFQNNPVNGKTIEELKMERLDAELQLLNRNVLNI